tara:strand:+ start:14456 stop:14641 length:186 start_codon:yes stop_codon:yes gene_type:complete
MTQKEIIAKLMAKADDINSKITLMENGHLGTSTDHPGFRTLIAKRNSIYDAIALVGTTDFS